MLKNEEGYKDPTPAKAMYHMKKKGGVMREADMERADQHRPKSATLDQWSEAQEQEALIEWANMTRNKFPMLFRLFHIANGGSRHPAEAVHLKKQGVKPGVPDLFLPWPVKPFHGLWVEMKSQTGRVSPLQVEWIEWLRSAGYAAFVCMGFYAAQDCILSYLKGQIPADEQTGKKNDIIWRGEKI